MSLSKLIPLATMALLSALPVGLRAAASGEHTASHVKAYADQYEGEKVSLDVAFIRFHRQAPDNVPYVFFWATTIDEDARSGGGAILVVADASDKSSLIRKYGTNLDREKREAPAIESLRGTVRVVEREGRPRQVYLDITDNGVDLSNAPETVFGEEEELPMGPPPGSGRRGQGSGE